MNKNSTWYKSYVVIMSLLALVSIILLILDFANRININNSPWDIIDKSILIIFAIDYFTRLIMAKNKWYFIKHNIFDLLAIIPFDNFFSVFRISRFSRLFRLLKILRMLRFVGIVGKFSKNIKKFLKTNGLIWVLSLSGIILLVASMTYSLSENVSFGEALWWSITTTTTVGYGDISPQTPIGKITAIFLMIVGIGIVGMLTSAITNFFKYDKDNDDKKEIIQELDQLHKENRKLNDKLDKINNKLNN